MISTYEQIFGRERVETTDGSADALRRKAYYLAIASFICNLVCTEVHFVTRIPSLHFILISMLC